jgi:hypothetical protein
VGFSTLRVAKYFQSIYVELISTVECDISLSTKAFLGPPIVPKNGFVIDSLSHLGVTIVISASPPSAVRE